MPFPFPGKRLLFLILPLALLLAPAGSQPPQPQSAAEAIAASRKLSADGQFQEAYTLAREARRLALASGSLPLLADALLEEGKYLARHGYPSQAIPLLDSLLDMEPGLGRLHPTLLLARSERADAALLTGEPEDHLARYQAIASDCEELPAAVDSLRGVLFQWIGQAYGYHDSLETALHYLRRSLQCVRRALPPDHLQIGYSHNALAIIHSYRGEPEEAMLNLESALRIFQQGLRPDHSHLIQVRSNLASLYLDDGLMWEAIQVLEQNLPLLDKVSPKAQFSSLYNYATARNMAGDSQTALRYLDQAEAIIRQLPGLDPTAPNKIAYLRAAAFEQIGQLEAANQFVQEGIRSDIALNGPDDPFLLTDYLRQGTILTKLERYPEALAAMREALRLSQRQQPPHPMRTGWVWEAMARVYFANNDPDSALICLRQAALLFDKPHASWNLAEVYSQMARAWRLTGQPDSNWHYVEKAWAMVLPELSFEASPGPQIPGYWHRISLPAILREQAASLHARAMKAEPRSCDYARAAMACLDACVTLADSQASYFDLPGSRQVQHKARTEALGTMAAWDQQFASLGTCYASQAGRLFLLAEQGKAVALREHLRGQRVPQFAGLPDSLLRQESKIRQRLAAFAHPDPGDSTRQTSLQLAFTEARGEYRRLIRQLQREYPDYYRLKYGGEPIPLSALQEQLKEGQVLMSYLASGDSLIGFEVEKKSLGVFSVPASVREALRPWLEFISTPPGQTAQPDHRPLTSAAHLACNALLPHLPEDHTSVVVLPDGWLHRLPFESLLTSNTESDDYRQWPFLGTRLRICYASNAALWVEESQQSPGSAEYVGLAPEFRAAPAGSSRAGLLPLLFNQQEVEQAAAEMGGRAFRQEEASEAVVKALQDPVVLHLATHAIAEPAEPLLSRLYLAPDSQAGEDGILYAHELYSMTLRSPLAVLSACETAAGPEEAGEGLNSLARAFQYAGCSQLLTTRWAADDPSTAQLIPRFFAEIRQGAASDEALLAARRHFLASSDKAHGHPYFWAHWMLIGDGQPLEKGHSWWWLAVIGLVGAGLWWKSRK